MLVVRSLWQILIRNPDDCSGSGGHCSIRSDTPEIQHRGAAEVDKLDCSKFQC